MSKWSHCRPYGWKPGFSPGNLGLTPTKVKLQKKTTRIPLKSCTLKACYKNFKNNYIRTSAKLELRQKPNSSPV